MVRGIYCYIREKILENIEEVNLPDFLLSEDSTARERGIDLSRSFTDSYLKLGLLWKFV